MNKENKFLIQRSWNRFKWIYTIVICVFLLNGLFIFTVRHHEKEDFIETGKIAAKQSSEALGLWIDNQKSLASLVTNAKTLRNWIDSPQDAVLRGELEKYLASIASRYEQIENVQVVKFLDEEHPWDNLESGEYQVKGMSVFARRDELRDLETTGTIEAIYDKKPYFISTIFSSSEQKPMFYYTVPIMGDQKIQGILTFTVELSTLTNALINEISYGKSGYLFFIDDRGKTIAHKNSSYIMNDASYLQDVVNNLLSRFNLGEAYFRGKFQGDWKTYYGIKSGLNSDYMRNQWYIVFTELERDVYELTNKIIWINLVSLMTLIGTIFVMGRKHELSVSLTALEEEREKRARDLEAELFARSHEAVKQISLDPLTQISHFQTVQREIDRFISSTPSEEKYFTLTLFHVDEMGAFNEREGMKKGDLLLNHIGKLMGEHFEKPSVVGRIYGDVFAIVLFDRNLIETVVQIEQFRKRYEQHVINFIQQRPSLSFGIAQWQGESSAELIMRAESQLKRAKKHGLRQVKY